MCTRWYYTFLPSMLPFLASASLCRNNSDWRLTALPWASPILLLAATAGGSEARLTALPWASPILLLAATAGGSEARFLNIYEWCSLYACVHVLIIIIFKPLLSQSVLSPFLSLCCFLFLSCLLPELPQFPEVSGNAFFLFWDPFIEWTCMVYRGSCMTVSKLWAWPIAVLKK